MCCSYCVKTGFTRLMSFSIEHRTVVKFLTMPEGVQRPWGSFTVLDDAPGYKVKRINVLPGHRLSYQKHFRRSEHWMTVSGRARVILDDCEILLAPGGVADIP